MVDFLAKNLKLTPDPSYLDLRGGRQFDLDKEMMLYSRPLQRRDRQPIDYSAMLLELLNIDADQ